MGTSSSRAGNNAPSRGDWTRAKRRVTNFTTGTGSSARSAIGGFVSAIGGRNAVSAGGAGGGRRGRLSSSVRVGQGLGGFLSQVVSEGLDQTLRLLGLGHLVGATFHDALSGIVDHICGDSGPLDDSIARDAVVEVLAEILDESDDTYVDLREWGNQLNEAAVIELMSLFLSHSIFLCFLADLGDRIESNATSARHAEQREQEILRFIKDMVISVNLS